MKASTRAVRRNWLSRSALRAGVCEYLTIEALPQPRLIWRSLDAVGSYRPMSPDGDGVYRSRVFPGLWLNPHTRPLQAIDRNTQSSHAYGKAHQRRQRATSPPSAQA